MTADLIDILVRLNLAASAAILAVVILRKPVRGLAGARLAYGLWLLVPLVVAAAFLPPRVVEVTLQPLAALTPQWSFAPHAPSVAAATPYVPPFDPLPVLTLVWALGLMSGLVSVVWRQARFVRELGELRLRPDALLQSAMARHGPSVIGFLRPRIVLPADFETRFTCAEQSLIIAHESNHVSAGHVQTVALAVVLQWLNWFNPLAHLAVHILRIDQELACDEAIVGRAPAQRRAYAQAMVKTQIAEAALPLGCYWPARGKHPLSERIALLATPRRSRARRIAGAGLVTAVAAAGATLAWAAQPPEVRTVSAETPPDLGVAVRPGSALDPNRPVTLSGNISGMRFNNPATQLWITDNAGHVTPVMTDGASNFATFGGLEAWRAGTVTIHGFASVDGSRVYADPAEIVMNDGAQMFPRAKAQPGLPQAISNRLGACGFMPEDRWGDGWQSNTDESWQSDCAKKAGQTGPGAPVKFSPFTNSVIRKGAALEPAPGHASEKSAAMPWASDYIRAYEAFFQPVQAPAARVNPPPPSDMAGKAAIEPALTPAGAATAPALEWTQPLVRRSIMTAPDWTRMPAPSELARAFPEAALRSGVGGWAFLQCKVSATGALYECSIAGETQGYDFGKAALGLTSRFVMRPQTRDGEAQDGAWVNIPVLFSLNGGEPEVPPMTLRPIPATEVRKVTVPGTYLQAGAADQSLR